MLFAFWFACAGLLLLELIENLNLVSENPRTDQVMSIIEPSLVDLGYELVRVHFGGGLKPVLQIMFDRTDGEEVAIDDEPIEEQELGVGLLAVRNQNLPRQNG